ncbi:hypothetical protein [Bosea sp. RAC05]|uniref:hypothetical protein n=1 Tax=Bosea sp. RAC05 TaxID=1842539 RepID=UPI00083E3FB9|nr:hypothetical protein [Bosea sp. RAC05]
MTLDADGVFVATSSRGDFRLALVNEGPSGQWHVTGPISENGSAPIVGAATSLDYGLSLMARAAFDAQDFRVNLPCGASFARSPRGRVPAEEVLAAYEYKIALEMTANAMISVAANEAPENVQKVIGIRSRMAGMEVVDVELIEVDGAQAHYCIELRYPFSGPLRTSTALAVVREAILEAGLEPAADYIEFTVPREVVANSAVVADFSRYRTAA